MNHNTSDTEILYKEILKKKILKQYKKSHIEQECEEFFAFLEPDVEGAYSVGINDAYHIDDESY